MKPFHNLTSQGQSRRLHGLARQALADYDLTNIQTTHLAAYTNTLIKVSAAEGVFVLRVSPPKERTITEIQSELAWINALRNETNLIVPEPILTRSGASLVTINAQGVPEPRQCVLFRWIEGRQPGDQLSSRVAYQAGATLAQLHDHADRFQPPTPFSTTQLEQAWPFGIPAGLTSDTILPLWPAERRRLLLQAGVVVQEMLDQLYAEPAGMRFLHLDFHPGNMKVHNGKLAVLDFDDTRWAYPVQDIGIALYYLFDQPTYGMLRSQFLAGYASVRPAGVPSAEQIDRCIVARQLDLLSYVVHENIASPEVLSDWLNVIERRIRNVLPALN